AISPASARRPSTSVGLTVQVSHRAAMPGLPGAATRRVTSGDWAIFQARECSRPPEPTRRMFMTAAFGARGQRGQARALPSDPLPPLTGRDRPRSGQGVEVWGEDGDLS